MIEPSNILCSQTTELIGGLSFDLTITTIDQFYQFPNEDEVIIINEYHHIIQNKPFSIVNSTLAGLWTFKNRSTYFCTATSNRGLEKILHTIVNTPEVLRFPSEYELINSVSPLDGGTIKPCEDYESKIEAIENEIVLNYDEKPIIIICDDKTK